MKPQATPKHRPFVEVYDYDQAIDLGRKHADKQPYNSLPDRLERMERSEILKKAALIDGEHDA